MFYITKQNWNLTFVEVWNGRRFVDECEGDPKFYKTLNGAIKQANRIERIYPQHVHISVQKQACRPSEPEEVRS